MNKLFGVLLHLATNVSSDALMLDQVSGYIIDKKTQILFHTQFAFDRFMHVIAKYCYH